MKHRPRHFCYSIQGARESNQDRVTAEETRIGGRPALLAAVADGMGGLREGDKAAGIAIETVQRYAREVFPALPANVQTLRQALRAMFQEANQAVFAFGQSAGAPGGIGTTLVAFLAFDGRYLIANAGDSRCYYINNGEARLLTEDHSRVQELVRQGAMTADAARRSPFRNQLTNSLGEPGEIPVDIYPASPHCGIIDEDCALLLCTDGMHGELEDADFHRLLHGTPDLHAAAQALAQLALERGSSDNITAAVAEFGRLARRAPRIPSGAARRPARKLSLLLSAVLLLILVLLAAGGLLLMRRRAERSADSLAKSGTIRPSELARDTAREAVPPAAGEPSAPGQPAENPRMLTADRQKEESTPAGGEQDPDRIQASDPAQSPAAPRLEAQWASGKVRLRWSGAGEAEGACWIHVYRGAPSGNASDAIGSLSCRPSQRNRLDYSPSAGTAFPLYFRLCLDSGATETCSGDVRVEAPPRKGPSPVRRPDRR